MSASTPWTQWLGSPRRRSLAGLFLALAAIPLLLGVDSCSVLRTPIGDPARGWADPRISGVWLSSEGSNRPLSESTGRIWVFEPFDATTWLVTLTSFNRVNARTDAANTQASAPQAASASSTEMPPSEPSIAQVISALSQTCSGAGDLSVYRAWLTSLGGRGFLVLQPPAELSVRHGLRPEAWLVYAVSLKDGRLILSSIDTNVEHLEAVTSRSRAEAIIARHARDPAFTKVEFVLHPVPRASFDDAESSRRGCDR